MRHSVLLQYAIWISPRSVLTFFGWQNCSGFWWGEGGSTVAFMCEIPSMRQDKHRPRTEFGHHRRSIAQKVRQASGK